MARAHADFSQGYFKMPFPKSDRLLGHQSRHFLLASKHVTAHPRLRPRLREWLDKR